MYSKRELLNWLWELGDGKDSPPKQAEIQEVPDAPSVGTYHHRFDDWATALKEAGYADRVVARRDICSEKQIQEYSDEELIRILVDMAAEMEGAPTQDQWRGLDDVPGTTTYRRRFGSWGEALRAAGSEPNKMHPGESAKEYSDEELLEHIRSVADDIGRVPSERDIRRADGPAPNTYRDRFGYWSRAKSIALGDSEAIETLTPLSETTAFQRDILAVLAANEGSNGGDLCRPIAAAYDEEITNARFYPAIDGLIERGLVAKRQPDARENAYRLTDDGRAALTADLDWRADLLADQ